MELVKNFGIDPILFIAQIVNFVVVLFVLKRFLYKPVLDMLRERENTIKLGQKQALEAQELLEKMQKEERIILHRAKNEAQKMLDDAKKQAKLMQEEIEQHAKKRTEKMILEAKEQIAQETQDAQNRLAKSTSMLAVSILNKALSEIMTSKDQDEIMNRAIKVLRKRPN